MSGGCQLACTLLFQVVYGVWVRGCRAGEATEKADERNTVPAGPGCQQGWCVMGGSIPRAGQGRADKYETVAPSCRACVMSWRLFGGRIPVPAANRLDSASRRIRRRPGMVPRA